jgi:hypothetical protein
MSVEQYQQQLTECFHGTTDPVAQQAAATANQYTDMVKAGQVSKEEYIELMADIQRTAEINKHVHNQQVLEHMNVAINGLINLAKLV